MDSLSAADDNVIQTFQLEESHIRGRAVRLGRVLDDILVPHDYPEAVARLVAESITLAALLSSMLKYEGIFTLQTKGDGPVRMLVADMTSDGVLRGCASFDAQKISDAAQNSMQYLGNGYLAFTVDPYAMGQRYQGIVELKGESLIDSVRHYFAQSEQIGAGIKMAVGRRGAEWRAGAVMLQRMAQEGGHTQASPGETELEDWRRSMILLGSCTDDELLNPHLHSNALLYRLFHEEGVRVFEPKTVRKGCRCDVIRVENMLKTMSDDDLDYMAREGKIEAKCEFCSKNYVFDRAALKGKIAE